MRKHAKHAAKRSREVEDSDERIRTRVRRHNEEPSTRRDVEVEIRNQHEQWTKIKHIEEVHFGPYELDAWYYSPYPEEVQHERRLYVCDQCLFYACSERVMRAHLGSCCMHNPPGRRIYAENKISVYEVDGDSDDAAIKAYTVCLCLFSKLFMDQKTIYFDLREYFFYILCERDTAGVSRPVAYFSKQKNEGHNLSCLLVFPPFLRRGYGLFLIQLSYELSRREGVVAGPEKPLSELGLSSYRRFWSWMIVEYFSPMMDRQTVTISELSTKLGIASDDLRDTLVELELIDPSNINITPVSPRVLDELRETKARQPSLLLNTRLLKWKPLKK